MRLLFISNNWADAHQQSRLRALLGLFESYLVFGFTRAEYYGPHSDVEPFWVGRMVHASYLSRLYSYFALSYSLIKTVQKDDVIYVFGFDLVVISVFVTKVSGRGKVVYEIPDIREVLLGGSMLHKLLLIIEKWVVKNLYYMVVTSEEYVTEYFNKIRRLSPRDYVVIENKVHADDYTNIVSTEGSRAYQKDSICVGYFGLLRCSRSLDCLIKLASEYGIQVDLYGIFMPSTRHYEELVNNTPNIHYHGSYQSPNQVATIYKGVDVVWAAYPYSSNSLGNHLWARTNRFYESLYFQKTPIVQKGTADARRASLLGDIALEVDLSESADIVVKSLTYLLNWNTLERYNQRITVLPIESYQITNEYLKLARCLQLNKYLVDE